MWECTFLAPRSLCVAETWYPSVQLPVDPQSLAWERLVGQSGGTGCTGLSYRKE